ncbi:MAG: ABC transporter permease [Thermofilaceae archaeon]
MNLQAVKVLALKEFRDLIRDPRIFIPFVLSAVIMPVIGVAISTAMQAAITQAVTGQTVAVADLDRTTLSRELVRWLSGKGFTVIEVSGGTLEELSKRAAESGASALLVIKPGFAEALEQGRKPSLDLVQILRDSPLFSLQGLGLADSVREFAARKLLEGKVSYDLVRDPVAVNSTIYMAAKGLLLTRPELLTGLSMAAMLIPLILLSIALVVMQMAATSVAVENEERTLETLLTLPISSYDVLLSKLLGMFAVSMLGTAFQVVGMFAYFYLILTVPFAFTREPGQALNIELMAAPTDITVIALSLLISLFFAAAVGMVIGVLSKDVRVANTLVGPLSMLFYIPALFILFAPSSALGKAAIAVLYTLPVTQPIVAARDMISARLPSEMPVYLVAALALTILIVYAASKLFSLETIATLQYRISSFIARRGVLVAKSRKT